MSVYIEKGYLSSTESDKKSNKATYYNYGTQFDIDGDFIDIPDDNKVQSGKQSKCLLNTVSFPWWVSDILLFRDGEIKDRDQTLRSILISFFT